MQKIAALCLGAAQNLTRTDEVALDVVQLLESLDADAVLAGDFAEAVPAAHFVVAVLGQFLLESAFGGEQLFGIEFDAHVPECALFKVENGGGVDVDALVAHLEVQVRPERAARVSSDADGVPGLELVADVHVPAGEVRIKRREAVPVVQDDVLAIAPAAALIADFYDFSGKSGHDSAVLTMAKAQIDAAVHAVGTDPVGACDSAAFGRDDGRGHVQLELLEFLARECGVSKGGELGVGFFLAHFVRVICRIGACFGSSAFLEFVFDRGTGVHVQTRIGIVGNFFQGFKSVVVESQCGVLFESLDGIFSNVVFFRENGKREGKQ